MKIDTFIDIVKPYTMTTSERIHALFDSLEYIRKNNIPGDFVECGVWKGGNLLGIAEYLNFYKMNDRLIYGYDTFSGMTQPEEIDVDFTGKPALPQFHAYNKTHNGWAVCSLDDVKKHMSLTQFPAENIKLIQGDILQTLLNEENITPNKRLSLLRLDTDWYKTTKFELEILYPILATGGVLIVDDYGHWKGSGQAVDEYFANNLTVNKIKIDFTAIKVVKGF